MTGPGAVMPARAEWRRRLLLAGRVLGHSSKHLLTDHGPQWAAALAYYAVLSLFPLLLALASVAAHFVDPQWAVGKAIAFLGAYLPEGRRQVEETVREALSARGPAGLLSLAALLWSGTRVFATLTTALNIAYDADETYPWTARVLTQLGMLLTVGVLFLLALASGFLLDLARLVLGVIPGVQEPVFRTLTSALPFVLLCGSLLLAYRYVPRSRPDWRAALIGALAAAVPLMLARPLFGYYVGQLASYNLIYGSLSIVVVLLVWAWLAALIVLFGGEVTSHVQMLVLDHRPVEEVEERHQARSPERRQPQEAQRHTASPTGRTGRQTGSPRSRAG